MNIKDLQKNWNEFGKTDPLWAILVDPTKKGRKWKIKEFFKTGNREIETIMRYIESLDIKISYKKALDFGCGAGRLTQALTNYFDDVHGVDIAPSMIKLANKNNRYNTKCHYHLNEENNLKLFEDNSFNFIYSNIVLQHMEPEYGKNYIKEFLRVIISGGLIVFQIPSEHSISSISNTYITFKADIVPINILDEMEPGNQKNLFVKVKNISNETWSISDNIRLGNHWLDKKKNIIILDDARSELNKDLIPGDEIELTLGVKAPNNSGDYLLELDMVKEGVTWFKDRGSKTAMFDIKVLYSHPIKNFIYSKIVQIIKRCNRNIIFHRNDPIMEMYEIKRSEILDLIKESGGRLIDIQEDYSVGKGWISYRYFITKDK